MTTPTPTPTRDEAVRDGRSAIVHAVASLAAAISLLERTPKAKKAAPSDRMFDQMLDDFRKALDEARRELTSASGGVEAAPVAWRRYEAMDNETAGYELYHDPVEAGEPLYTHPPLASAPAPASGRVDAVAAEREACAVLVDTMARYATKRSLMDDLHKVSDAIRSRASLSPAATPVSEAGGEIDLTIQYLRCADDDLASAGEKLISTRFSNVRAVIRDAIAVLERAALAKPASSPAGGDVVREGER